VNTPNPLPSTQYPHGSALAVPAPKVTRPMAMEPETAAIAAIFLNNSFSDVFVEHCALQENHRGSINRQATSYSATTRMRSGCQ
jgi:hypothetical protein